jgi:D-threo-aldose 1-dehydrogenase
MKRNVLGRSGLGLSELCFGGSAIGNLYREVSDEDAAGAVDAAWTVGIRYYDTAPHYGLGLSEQRLGDALRTRPRDEYVLSTKVGRLLVANETDPSMRDDGGFAVAATTRRRWDFSASGVRRSLEESLSRLGLERIDIAYLHDPDDHWQQAIDEAYPALESLRAQGMIGAIGAGMNQAAMLESFVRDTDMDLVMAAGCYTLLDQSALTTLLPLCLERSVGVVNVGVFNSGLLARPDPQPGMHFNYAAASVELVDRARQIAGACRRFGVTLPAAAIQFAAGHPAVVSTAIGARDSRRVDDNVELFRTTIPAELWAELKLLRLLPEHAPVPT